MYNNNELYLNKTSNTIMNVAKKTKAGKVFEYRVSEANLNSVRNCITRNEKQIDLLEHKLKSLQSKDLNFFRKRKLAQIKKEISKIKQVIKDLQKNENTLISYRLKNYPF